MSRSFRYQSNAAAELSAILDYIEQRSTIGAVNWLDEYKEPLFGFVNRRSSFQLHPKVATFPCLFKTRSLGPDLDFLTASFL